MASAAGTPLYVYSAATLRERYTAIDAAFGEYPHALHYALTANSTMAIARLVKELGGKADANSVWEIELARKAGFEPAAIVFTGVGKSADEDERGALDTLHSDLCRNVGERAAQNALVRRCWPSSNWL